VAFAVGVGDELWRTTDRGATWHHVWNVSGFLVRPRSVGFHPTQPGVALAGADGMYRSTDGGATWSAVTAAGLRVRAFAIDPARPSTIYLVTEQGAAVLRSVTGLATVVPFDAGLPAGAGRSIAVDRDGGAVYLGTAFGGLRRLGS